MIIYILQVDSVPLQMPNLENDAARVVDIDKDRKVIFENQINCYCWTIGLITQTRL